jgi:hypothetical protein
VPNGVRSVCQCARTAPSRQAQAAGPAKEICVGVDGTVYMVGANGGVFHWENNNVRRHQCVVLMFTPRAVDAAAWRRCVLVCVRSSQHRRLQCGWSMLASHSAFAMDTVRTGVCVCGVIVMGLLLTLSMCE